MKPLLRLGMGLLGLAVVVVVGVWVVCMRLDAPGPLEKAIIMEIPQGAPIRNIAAILDRNQVISHPVLFYLRFYAFEKATTLQAGEYEFAAGISLNQVLQKLIRGDVIVHAVTIPEGWTSARVRTLLNQQPDLSGEPIVQLDEGVVLPETYHYRKGESRQALLDRMKQHQLNQFQTRWHNRSSGLPLKSLDEAIVLASMVEKESGKSSERARIAGVFYNRLKLGMPLQSDPTVIYGLTKGEWDLGRLLTYDDLRHESPFNTYKVRGLIMTPICNPGTDALDAVLHPISTRELYFVADGEGGHRFATTLNEHHANVAKLRRLQIKP